MERQYRIFLENVESDGVTIRFSSKKVVELSVTNIKFFYGEKEFDASDIELMSVCLDEWESTCGKLPLPSKEHSYRAVTFDVEVDGEDRETINQYACASSLQLNDLHAEAVYAKCMTKANDQKRYAKQNKVDFHKDYMRQYLDLYYAGRPPEGKDEKGNGLWNPKVMTYTGVGFLIYDYKKRKNKGRIDELVQLFLDSGVAKSKFDVIIPAPSSSEMLHIDAVAQRIAEKLGIRYTDCLRKNDDVEIKRLRNEARTNRRNFVHCCVESLDADSVLLIDDMYTTGNTLDACVNAIRTVNSQCDITAFVFCKHVRKNSGSFAN